MTTTGSPLQGRFDALEQQQQRITRRWKSIGALGFLLLAFAAISLLVAAAARIAMADDAASAADWKAPPEAAQLPNPIPSDDASVAAGKSIYAKNCLACHGRAGHGDGPAASSLKPRPRDLSDPKIAGQTDGELFWKTTTGRNPMPKYQKVLSDEDRWKVVNYMRVLAPRPATQP
jgi:mono/diheme cytochrome c family protein